MAPHSSTLAWKIPWTVEPGMLQSMESLSRTGLSDFTFTFHFHALDKEMATHSSVLAWRILGTGDPGGLQSMGSHRVGHDWSNLAAAAAAAAGSEIQFSSVAQSCPALCDLHESQHTRPPCPSPTPRVHSDSCPSSQWCHPAISSSFVPFSSCRHSLPASESFPMRQLFRMRWPKYWSFSKM